MGQRAILYARHSTVLGGREGTIYATLRDASSGELIINADLDYVLKAIKARGYVLVLPPKESAA